MKKLTSTILALALILCCAMPSFADNTAVDSYTVNLEDGYYIVCTVYETPSVQTYNASATRVKSGNTTAYLYDNNDERIASATVYGTFEYDGSRAEAISARYSYDIYNSAWSLDSGRAYCDGATAVADVTFGKFLAKDLELIVTLTCSPDGVLS